MKFIIKYLNKIIRFLGLFEIKYLLNKSNSIQTQLFLETKLQHSKYLDCLRLNKYEFQSHSQDGEDGIIHEIFERIGTKKQLFCRILIWNGLQNNSAYLLVNGWCIDPLNNWT